MRPSDVRVAVQAAMTSVSALGLKADDAVILRDSDKLMLRLMPCDVVARIEHEGRGCAEFEVELAQQLAANGSPVAALDPRVEPRVYRRDAFAFTLWSYYESEPSDQITAAEYADALERYHDGLRRLTMATPRFTDRVDGAEEIVVRRDLSPRLTDSDRAFLTDALRSLRQELETYDAPEQPLHGEPHLGNVLKTKDGLVFIDIETCCRGPIEFDIAHVAPLPGSTGLDIDELAARYARADPELIDICIPLMLALITAWRWNEGDELPDGKRLGVEWLNDLRSRL